MDAVQDSCIKAWRGIGEQRGGAFRSWMSCIVARTCVDQIRRRHSTAALEDEDDRVIPLPDPQPGPELRALTRERARSMGGGVVAVS